MGEINIAKFEYKLIDRCPRNLGFDTTAKVIFSKINAHEEAIIDFEGIEFMSRNFAQGYVAQKHLSKTKITEINKNEFIERLLKLASEEYEEYFNVTI